MRVASREVGASRRPRPSHVDAAPGTLPPYDGVAPRQCPAPPIDAALGRVEESYRGETDSTPESRTRATLMAIALALVGLLIGYATYYSSSYGPALGFALACATALVALPFAPSLLRRQRRLVLTSTHLLVREVIGWRAVEWADLTAARFSHLGGRSRGVPGRGDIRDWELLLLGADGEPRARLGGGHWGYDVLMRVAALFGSVRVSDASVAFDDSVAADERAPRHRQLKGLAGVRRADVDQVAAIADVGDDVAADLVGPGAAEREVFRTRREKREARTGAPTWADHVAGWLRRVMDALGEFRADLTVAYGGPRQLAEAAIWILCVIFLVAVFLGGTMSAFSVNPLSRW